MARDVIEQLEKRVLLSAGQPDPGFGTAGVVTTSFGDARDSAYLQGLALQPDGKILVTGDATQGHPPYAPVNDFPLVRYTSAGALDASFGQGGIVLVPGSGSGRAVAVQPDGKILVAARLGLAKNDLPVAI